MSISSDAGPAPVLHTKDAKVRMVRLNFPHAGVIRRAHVWLPPRPRDAPVVLDLHGSGFDPERHAEVSAIYQWTDLGAVVVLPCAALPLTFDPRTAPGWAWEVPGVPLYQPGGAGSGSAVGTQVDDVGFLDKLVSLVQKRWNTNPDRVFGVGYSGGARMLSWWAGENSCPLTAACCVAGVRASRRPGAIRMLAVHTTGDSLNPFDGSADPRWLRPVLESAGTWATDQAAYSAVSFSAGRIRHQWRGPDGKALVELVELHDGGHAWPGTCDREQKVLLGEVSRYDASRAAAEFFGLSAASA